MTAIYGIGIMMALLAGGAIGLLLTVAHYHRVAARYRRYEQEVVRDREPYAAARKPYSSTASQLAQTRKATAP